MPFAENGGNKLYYEDTGGDGTGDRLLPRRFFSTTRCGSAGRGASRQLPCITWDDAATACPSATAAFDTGTRRGRVGVLDAAGVEKAVARRHVAGRLAHPARRARRPDSAPASS